jgi:hypothetical protein
MATARVDGAVSAFVVVQASDGLFDAVEILSHPLHKSVPLLSRGSGLTQLFVASVESWGCCGRTVVHPGDVTPLYSDAVTEATNRSGDEFGVGRLSAIVAAEGAAISTACRRGLNGGRYLRCALVMARKGRSANVRHTTGRQIEAADPSPA